MAGTWSTRRPAQALAALALVIALAAVGARPAEAANRRVAIGNYSWSPAEIRIDLGEHVTWHWVGPDTAHSVTGDSANARGLDSDPQTELPAHRAGDTFSLTFDQPGSYSFICKLHSIVGGTVVVSATPGDPVSEPDPVPRTFIDSKAPRIRDLRLTERDFPGRGTTATLSLDERSKLDAEYFRLEGGERRFAGFSKWKGYVGINHFRFGARGPRFAARPGRYEAVVRATDSANNVSRPRKVRFEIR